MLYTSYEFQKKWSSPLSWNMDNSRRINMSTFLTELIVEIDNISEQLLLSLLTFSKKNLIHYLTDMIDMYLKNKNTYNFSPSNYSFPTENIFLPTSCFSPPETVNIDLWYSKPVKSLDEILSSSPIDMNYTKKINSCNYISKYSNTNSEVIDEDVYNSDEMQPIFIMDEDYETSIYDNMAFLVS